MTSRVPYEASSQRFEMFQICDLDMPGDESDGRNRRFYREQGENLSDGEAIGHQKDCCG